MIDLNCILLIDLHLLFMDQLILNWYLRSKGSSRSKTSRAIKKLISDDLIIFLSKFDQKVLRKLMLGLLYTLNPLMSRLVWLSKRIVQGNLNRSDPNMLLFGLTFCSTKYIENMDINLAILPCYSSLKRWKRFNYLVFC